MLTVKKIRELLTDFFLESLALDSGIVEFFGIDKYSIAISYETGDKSDPYCEDTRYIFNLFNDGEYININYYPGDKGLNDTVLQEVVNRWNELVDIKDIVVERIRENASNAEIEEILGEQITGDLVEDLETHLGNALYELTEEGFAETLMKYLTPVEIGNICKLSL